jgi:hypothetical protein
VTQVPLHRAPAEEQSGANLGVRQAIAGELGDLTLLRSQIVARLDGPLAGCLARGQQLTASPFGERLHAHRRELLVRCAQLGPGVNPAVRPSKPLAEEQMRAGELSADPGSIQLLDRLAIRGFGIIAFAEKRPTARLDAKREAAASGLRGRRELVQRVPRNRRVTDARGSLNQLEQRPHG